MAREIKRILITPGEPAGIGPDITIAIASASWDAELIVIADPQVLYDRAKQLDVPLTLVECDLDKPSQIHRPHTLQILPIKCETKVTAGSLDEENASYVIKTLESAAAICLDNKADALVTGPVHKGIINHAGIPFTGHTEFFAHFCQVKNTVMLFVVDDLKIALATTHLPLAKVPSTLTSEHLTGVLSILNEGLKKYFGMTHPTIFVSGLNPHAGEDGHLGREEIETIGPAIIKLREQNLLVYGPFPADTLFTQKYLRQADAFLAMYHDQALPLVKYIGFDHAVNVTLGLPFLRTSVDHGTALDIAGKGMADAGSMTSAIEFAINFS